MEVLNVIEVINNKVIKVKSFIIDDNKGKHPKVTEAEKLFTEMALENGAREDEIETHIEDGYYEGGAEYCVNLVWS